MSKPWVHAKNSARKFGGRPEDYLPIHNLMDSSKGSMGDNRHRCLTHNSWFISAGGPLEMIFGVTMTNSDGKEVSVRDLGEQHVLEDFGMKFIPTAQDYLQEMEIMPWMNNMGGVPCSHKRIESARPRNKKKISLNID
jgi:hypothetical protein